MHINIQNNQENSYEKFKKFLNNPITKLSLSTAGGIVALSLIAKLIYDKIHQNKHQNKIYKELIINDVILSIADQGLRKIFLDTRRTKFQLVLDLLKIKVIGRRPISFSHLMIISIIN